MFKAQFKCETLANILHFFYTIIFSIIVDTEPIRKSVSASSSFIVFLFAIVYRLYTSVVLRRVVFKLKFPVGVYSYLPTLYVVKGGRGEGSILK